MEMYSALDISHRYHTVCVQHLCFYYAFMRVFIHQINMVDSNKQSKSNQMETVTAETKKLSKTLNNVFLHILAICVDEVDCSV